MFLYCVQGVGCHGWLLDLLMHRYGMIPRILCTLWYLNGSDWGGNYINESIYNQFYGFIGYRNVSTIEFIRGKYNNVNMCLKFK